VIVGAKKFVHYSALFRRALLRHLLCALFGVQHRKFQTLIDFSSCFLQRLQYFEFSHMFLDGFA